MAVVVVELAAYVDKVGPFALEKFADWSVLEVGASIEDITAALVGLLSGTLEATLSKLLASKAGAVEPKLAVSVKLGVKGIVATLEAAGLALYRLVAPEEGKTVEDFPDGAEDAGEGLSAVFEEAFTGMLKLPLIGVPIGEVDVAKYEIVFSVILGLTETVGKLEV